VLRVKGEDIRLMLWDTAGQEEFDAITKAYYRGKLKHYISTTYLYIVMKSGVITIFHLAKNLKYF